MSEVDDWYEEEKDEKPPRGKKQKSNYDGSDNEDDVMDDLVNANYNSDEDIEDVMAEEERRRMQRR